LRQPEISIVVPVYCAALHLRETLDALAAQRFHDFEVILVDDGSTDSSPQIIDSYCGEDSRFRALHIPNGGEYHARQAGIREAVGRYIAFCDSDDLYLPDMLEKMYDQAEKTGADVTVCGFQREDMDSGKIYSREMCGFEARSVGFPELWDILPLINPSLWNKLFRSEILHHAVRLAAPPRVAEDVMVSASVYPFVNRMAFVPEVLYRYRVHPGSIISGITPAETARVRESMLITRDFILNGKDSKETREYIDSIAFIHLGLSLVIRLTQGGEPMLRTVRDARAFLDASFPGYRKAGKGLLWNLNHHMLQFRILLGRWFFCAHMMVPFLLVYHFVTLKLKREIKW